MINIEMLKKYLSIEMLCLQVEKDFEDFINKTPESRQEEKIIAMLKKYKESSTSGNPEARNIIKSQIKTNLLSSFNIYRQDEEGRLEDIALFRGIKLEQENGYIDFVLPFCEPEKLTPGEKFAVLLYKNRRLGTNGRDEAFRILTEKYAFYEKSRVTEEYKSVRYEYSSGDIETMYKAEDIRLSFGDKLEIVVQLIYERLFGLMELDTLAYSDINEVGFSDNGRYIYCWCGRKYWLSFMTLREDEARLVQDRAISFDKSVGQLDKNNPERLCHRADGARITVTQPPYFSARNLCIRIFNQSHTSYRELESSEKLRILTTALIKSGESISLQGGLGTGKTTKMETMFEILDDCLHIGTVEDYFEQHIMKKYPDKRIVEAQSINGKSLLDAVKTLLRMSVDVADLGEVRDGEALFAFIQLVQSVSIAAWFTTHIVNPGTTVPRLKNMLMGTGRYLTEQAAIMDIIHYINVIFQHEIVKGRRLISQVTEIVPLVEASAQYDTPIGLDTDRDTLEKLYFLQKIQSNPSNMYRLNTIVDTIDGEVRFVNFPSRRMVERARRNPEARGYMDRLLSMIEAELGRTYE